MPGDWCTLTMCFFQKQQRGGPLAPSWFSRAGRALTSSQSSEFPNLNGNNILNLIPRLAFLARRISPENVFYLNNKISDHLYYCIYRNYRFGQTCIIFGLSWRLRCCGLKRALTQMLFYGAPKWTRVGITALQRTLVLRKKVQSEVVSVAVRGTCIVLRWKGFAILVPFLKARPHGIRVNTARWKKKGLNLGGMDIFSHTFV